MGRTTSSPSKATKPASNKPSKTTSPNRPWIFSPNPPAPEQKSTSPRETHIASATLAGTRERNKSRQETRILQSAPITGEQAGFALAAQCAILRNEVQGRAPETVVLITSLPPERLKAVDWLQKRRDHWGIETGLHARLDVSRRDDECRMRNPHAIHLHGIFTRLANSLMEEWRSHQARPNQKTTTDFAATMSANHARRVIRTVTSKNPNLRSPS